MCIRDSCTTDEDNEDSECIDTGIIVIEKEEEFSSDDNSVEFDGMLNNPSAAINNDGIINSPTNDAGKSYIFFKIYNTFYNYI